MSKPTLYVALEGPLLLPGGEIANYARSFLYWAKHLFKVVVVTEGTARNAFLALSSIGEPNIPVRTFLDTKANMIKPGEDFYWVDGELIPSEVSFLAQHGRFDRFFQTDPVKGVTVDTKSRLEARLRTRRKK